MITLEDKSGNKIRLSDHLIWIDWGMYSDIATNRQRTIDGSQVIEVTKLKAGMPITLAAAPTEGLKYRREVEPLNKMMLENIGESLTLTMHDNKRYNVTFIAENGVPIEATPLIPYSDPIDSDYIGLILRFVTVEESL